MDRYKTITRRIDLLRRFDSNRQVFGAHIHGYEAHPVWSKTQVVEFEKTHNVTLPKQYSIFLQTIASSGVGPYYGLFEPTLLEHMPPTRHSSMQDEADSISAEHDGAVLTERAHPYVLKSTWKVVTDSTFMAQRANPYDGHIVLAEQGCGVFSMLLVRGAYAGEVWSSGRRGDGAICKEGDDFLQWYEAWTEHAMLELIQKTSFEFAYYAPPNFEGFKEPIEVLERTLKTHPEDSTLWRTLGYVRINQERWDEVTHAFELAAKYGKNESAARLYLDLARFSNFKEDFDTALAKIAQGLKETEVWASTRADLFKARLEALDGLGREQDALVQLEEMMAHTFFHREHHFDKAQRELKRQKPKSAWATLQDAIERNVGEHRHKTPATREHVYNEFIAWLQEDEEIEFIKLVRAHM